MDLARPSPIPSGGDEFNTVKASGIDGDEACEHAAKKLRRQSSDAATGSLMNMEPGVLLRREQLTADFRENAVDAGDQDDGEGGEDLEETPKPPRQRKPKAKGKAKAKPAAKATAKAKAAAKAKGKPKAKAAAKAKGTPKSKVATEPASRAGTKKAKIDSKAKKAETEELEEVGGAARPKIDLGWPLHSC